MRNAVAILTAILALPFSTWSVAAADGPAPARAQLQTTTRSPTTQSPAVQSLSRRLIVVDGDVKVSRAGGGFVKGFVGLQLQAGDRVLVGHNSHAKISYDDHCIERVRMDRIIVVQRYAPCGLEGWETVSVGEVSSIGGIGGIIGASPVAVGIGAAAVTGIVAGIATHGLRPGSATSP